MTHEADLSDDDLSALIVARITSAFQHIYPSLPAEAFDAKCNEDETWTVHVDHPTDPTAWRAVIYSDDDGFLRFTPYDEDDDSLDDDHDFMSLRIRILAD